MSILFTILGVCVSIAFNEFNKEFYDALQIFNHAALKMALVHFVVILTLMVMSYGYAFYYNNLLCLHWRRWLTQFYLEKWLNDKTHYHMQQGCPNLDNPDQRMSEDLEKLPEISLTLFFILLNAALQFVSFGYILWRLSGNYLIEIPGLNFFIHGYLFWCAVMFGFLGVSGTRWLGVKLVALNYQQQQYDANFRFALVRVREASEQIGLYQGEKTENAILKKLFSPIQNNFLIMTQIKKRLTFFSSGFGMAGHMIGVLFSLPLYLQKKIQFGGMMQVSGAFSSVIGAFSMLVKNFNLLAEWKSVVLRLNEFGKMIDENKHHQTSIQVRHHQSEKISIKNVNIYLPDGTILLQGIDLSFKAGVTFLLTGKSGIGKSLLLKAIASCWRYGEGEIIMPENKKIFFLPQKPYLPLGSLKEILLYPNQKEIHEDLLKPILEICFLDQFQSQLNDVQNWAQALSLGEQQLIGFARIFVHKPDFVFLDEAASALDAKTEMQMYQRLKMALPHAAIISIGYRENLYPLHDEVICLDQMSAAGCSPRRAADFIL